MGLNEQITSVLSKVGYLGVFWVSFISNSIPYMALPYLFFIILYVNQVKPDFTSKLLIMALSTLGASLGKIIVYSIGYGLRSLILKQHLMKTTHPFRLFRKSIFIATLLFALLPLPDDILFIPLGMMKYDIKRYFVALFLGKFVLTFVTIHLGAQAYWLLEETAGLPTWLSILAMVLLTLYVTYLLSQIDWFKIVQLASEKKTLLAIGWFFREVIVKTFKMPIYVLNKVKHINPRR